MDKRSLLAGASIALLTAAFATSAFAQSPTASPLGVGAPLASAAASQGVPAASLAVENVDPPHPAHIHDGLCPDPGDIVQPLSDLVVGTDKPVGVASAIPVEVSASKVPMSLDDILNGQRSINVHASADDMNTYIACGDIGGQMLGTNGIAIGLAELNGSGHQGVAWLQDNGDGTTNVQVFLINNKLQLSGNGGAGASAAPVASVAPAPSASPGMTTVPVTTTVPEQTVLPQPTVIPSQVPVMTTVPSVVPSVVASIVPSVVPEMTPCRSPARRHPDVSSGPWTRGRHRRPHPGSPPVAAASRHDAAAILCRTTRDVACCCGLADPATSVGGIE